VSELGGLDESLKEAPKMPLKKGGKKAVQDNIKELYHANDSKPAGEKRKRDQIVAIAYAAARRKKK
jgi:hypothetical protein